MLSPEARKRNIRVFFLSISGNLLMSHKRYDTENKPMIINDGTDM